MPFRSSLIILIIFIFLAGCTQLSSSNDTSVNQGSALGSIDSNMRPLTSPPPTTDSAPATRRQSPAAVTPSPTPQPSNLPQQNPGPKSKPVIELVTSKGTITLELYPDQAPNTASNFLSKAKSGFYQGLIFHRVEDWVIQGGDPQGTGSGGGQIPTETSDLPFTAGSLGVARGSDISISNDSQFFICTKDCLWLNGQYTNFGQVTQGLEVAGKIEIGDTITSIRQVN